MKRLLLPLLAFLKRFGQDYLDEDSYLENIDSEFIKANPLHEDMDPRFRHIFVDFADYDHFPITEDIENKQAKEKTDKFHVLPSNEDLP